MSTTELNALGAELPPVGSLVKITQEAIEAGYFPGTCLVLDHSWERGLNGDTWWDLELLWPDGGGMRSWIPADYTVYANE